MKAGVIKLGWPQWALVLATVVVVVPTVVFLVIPNDAGAWLIRRFELPGCERALGFEVARVRLPTSSGFDQPVFSIIKVVQGSAFDNAGVRPGDIPSLGYSGGETGFLWGLFWGARLGSMTVYLTSWEEAARGEWRNPRKVTVIFPPKPRKPPA
jgi:hypothetical protein